MKKIMILSGAGLSAESGIKTFRDNDGLWENYDVMQVCSAQGFRKDRALVTQFYNDRRKDLEDKLPNDAHKYFASLEKKYPNQIIHLTQNVDNLLEKAGAKELIHLHGTLTDLRCESCEEVFNIGYNSQDNYEFCPNCNSKNIRHNVVMFGESAPEYAKIERAIKECSLFIAIGTSGAVIDIVSIAKSFEESILINPKQEEHVGSFGSFDVMIDSYFTHFIQAKANESIDALDALIIKYLK